MFIFDLVFTDISGGGDLKALAHKPLELFWHHNVPNEETNDCGFSYYHKSLDQSYKEAFLLYSNKTGLLSLGSRGEGWSLISDKTPCWSGIKKSQSQDTDSGIYLTSLILTNGSLIKSPEIEVTIYEGRF